MRISSSSISLASQHTSVKVSSREERLRLWVGEPRREAPAAGAARGSPAPLPSAPAEKPRQGEGGIEERMDRFKLKLVLMLLRSLAGKKLEPGALEDAGEEAAEAACPALEAPSPVSPQQPSSAGWGLAYDYRETHYERESLTFSARGVVRTADGQAIAIDVDLNLSREFLAEQSVSLRAGDAVKVDPLVINFDGTAAELTQTRFSFDLDVDGQAEAIPFAAAGSGFLALDANGNGAVDDGSELFGPASGNGFGELASHDGDGNGWIDAGDAVFTRLRVWTKDAQGNDYLLPLDKYGVGAIFLGSVQGRFEYKAADGAAGGEAQRLGIYLREDGLAGVVQHIDLVV